MQTTTRINNRHKSALIRDIQKNTNDYRIRQDKRHNGLQRLETLSGHVVSLAPHNTVRTCSIGTYYDETANEEALQNYQQELLALFQTLENKNIFNRLITISRLNRQQPLPSPPTTQHARPPGMRTSTRPSPVPAPSSSSAPPPAPQPTAHRNTPSPSAGFKPSPEPLPPTRISPRGNRPNPIEGCNYIVPIRQGEYVQDLLAEPTTYDAARNLLIQQTTFPAMNDRLNDPQGAGSRNGAVRFFDRKYDQANRLNNYYLSNTYKHQRNGRLVPLIIDGQPYDSVEHYFQCMKFLQAPAESASQYELSEAIRSVRKAPSGGAAASTGGSRGAFGHLINLNRWDKIKYNIMMTGIMAKFEQIPELRNKLLRSWPNILIEHTTDDALWGNNGDDSGMNMTGQILGFVRDRLIR